jgi:hypothetical protein
MKKQVLCVLLALTLLLSTTASAMPGTHENPVVTLRYIEDDYLPSVYQKAALAAERRMDSVFADITGLLGNNGNMPLNEAALIRKIVSRISQLAPSSGAIGLKAGSVLTLGQGASLIPVSGSSAHRGGVLTNSTAGQDVAAGSVLLHRNRYFGLSEETSVKITSDAVFLLQGGYRVTPPYVPMYTDLCEALMMMEIINTYELPRITMRTEMFIIFITILGVKDEASATAGTHPFTDCPEWFEPYLIYLYDNGHTAGTGNNRFSPDDTGSVQQLSFILLKALGYQDGIDVSYASAVNDAVRLGLFTRRELEILQSEEFTRDAMMYMTYYSLFARYKDSGERVIDRLIRVGQVKQADADRAFTSVWRSRF